MQKVENYLRQDLIYFLSSRSREEVIATLVDNLRRQEVLEDASAFHEAILQREHLISTGIGMGVAIPHAKLSIQQEFFIAIGIQKYGIDWQALDGIPVKLVFMIGGSELQQTQYLQLLSKLTLAIKDEEHRKKMLQLTSAKEIFELFQGI